MVDKYVFKSRCKWELSAQVSLRRSEQRIQVFPDKHSQKVGGGRNIGTFDRIASGNGATGALSVQNSNEICRRWGGEGS
jgi:hypothetical protein